MPKYPKIILLIVCIILIAVGAYLLGVRQRSSAVSPVNLVQQPVLPTPLAPPSLVPVPSTPPVQSDGFTFVDGAFYKGEVTVGGQYYYSPFGSTVCFEVNSDQASLFPEIKDRGRASRFCFENDEEAAQLFYGKTLSDLTTLNYQETPAYETPRLATIRIQDLMIYLGEGDGWHRTRLLQIITKQ